MARPFAEIARELREDPVHAAAIALEEAAIRRDQRRFRRNPVRRLMYRVGRRLRG